MREADRSSPGRLGHRRLCTNSVGRVAAAVGEGARSALHSGRCRPPAFLLNFDNAWDDDPARARANSAAAELIPIPDHLEYAATPSPLSNYRSPELDSIQTDLGSV
jgi:hypothetical protein